jgi:hypothetical protein
VVDHVLRHDPFERSRVSGREGGDELAGNVFVLFEHPFSPSTWARLCAAIVRAVLLKLVWSAEGAT